MRDYAVKSRRNFHSKKYFFSIFSIVKNFVTVIHILEKF